MQGEDIEGPLRENVEEALALSNDIKLPSTFRAAVCETHGQPFEFKEVAVKHPAPGQALVRIVATGVCHTDVHAVDGDWIYPTKLPLTPGHEGCGVVEAVGERVTHIKVGPPC